VDGQRQGSLRVSSAERAGTWRWVRADGLSDETNPLLAQVLLFLTAGEHQVSLGFYGATLQLDCLVLSTDPTQNSLPMISPFGPQTVVAGQTIGPLPFSVLDLESPPSALTVSATVGNTNLIPVANIQLAGEGPNWTLMLTVPAEQSGATTVTLTALDSDRNVRSTSFPVTVVGVLRSRVEAANAGDTVVMAAGTFFDNVTLSKDLTIEAEQTGATVIDGKGLGIPFTITNNATVHLRGLVIRNGRGGGVKNFGTLRLSDCVITANLEKSGPHNGGVVNFGALTMERCVVSGNSAAYGAGVHNLGTLSLSECTIRDNVAGARGGGIYNQPSGRLVLYRSALHSNRVSYGNGAGLYNAGDLAAWNVTISGNSAKRKDDEGDGGLGGGVFNLGTALLESCTIANNQATVAAGGIANEKTLALRNSIVARNALADGTPDDGRGLLTSHGFNLVQTPHSFTWRGVTTGNRMGVDPLLAPLADYGGATPTHTLLEGSPAIDSGSSDGLCVDQRGAPRRWDEPSAPNAHDAGDIGAAEFLPAAAVPAVEATEVEAPAGAVAPAGSLYDRGCEVDTTHARLHPGPSSGGPFRLLLTTRTPVGTFVVEASANLTDWVPIGTVVVDGYLGLFEDPGAANSPLRFYRAVLETR